MQSELEIARTQAASDAAEIARLKEERADKEWESRARLSEARLATMMTVTEADVETLLASWFTSRHINLEPGDPSYEEMRPQARAALENFVAAKLAAPDQPADANAPGADEFAAGLCPSDSRNPASAHPPGPSDDQADGGEGPKGGPLVQLLSDTLDRIYDIARAEFTDLATLASRPSPPNTEAVRVLVEALEEAQHVLLGDQPEDISQENALAETKEKVRRALNNLAVTAALSGDPWMPIASAPREPTNAMFLAAAGVRDKEPG